MNATLQISHTAHVTTHLSDKPYSPASERNRDPILTVLRRFFADRRHVLEVGSGTGQHAAYFAAHLPALNWQASDRVENLPGIRAWLDEAALPNTPAPIEFDVASQWPALHADALFSANTLHIMRWSEVLALFAGLEAITTPDAKLAIYGPFNYAGEYTSASNAAFDASLRARAPHMGIRDFVVVDGLAASAGFRLCDDFEMPANNRLLTWQRRPIGLVDGEWRCSQSRANASALKISMNSEIFMDFCG